LSITTPNNAATIAAIKIATYEGRIELRRSIITITHTMSTIYILNRDFLIPSN